MTNFRTEGRYHMPRLLWSMAERLRHSVDQPGAVTGLDASTNLIGCMVFAFFSIEAYANHMLMQLDPANWKATADLPVLERLKRVYKEADLHWNRDVRPINTIISMKHFRDKIAHAGIETFVEVSSHSTEVHDEGKHFHKMMNRVTRGEAKLQDVVTPIYADIVLSDGRSFTNAVHGPLLQKLMKRSGGVMKMQDLLMDMMPAEPLSSSVMMVGHISAEDEPGTG